MKINSPHANPIPNIQQPKAVKKPDHVKTWVAKTSKALNQYKKFPDKDWSNKINPKNQIKPSVNTQAWKFAGSHSSAKPVFTTDQITFSDDAMKLYDNRPKWELEIKIAAKAVRAK